MDGKKSFNWCQKIIRYVPSRKLRNSQPFSYSIPCKHHIVTIIWSKICSHDESQTHKRYTDIATSSLIRPECPRTHVSCFPGVHSGWLHTYVRMAQKWPRGHIASYHHQLLLLQCCYTRRKRNLCTNCTNSADVVDQSERARTHALCFFFVWEHTD